MTTSLFQPVRFVVPGTPVGKGRPRAARRGAHTVLYTPEKTASYENLVRVIACEAMRGRVPTIEPVACVLVLTVTPPVSWSAKKITAALAGEIMPTTKPDLDNVVKGIFDACNGIVWGDDRQVVEVFARKRYGVAAQAIVQVCRAGILTLEIAA